jgi:hypothetical protein
MARLTDFHRQQWYGHQNGLSKVGVPSYLGFAIPGYVFGSVNLVECPGCVTSLRSMCVFKPYQPILDTTSSIAIAMKASPRGACLMTLPGILEYWTLLT